MHVAVVGGAIACPPAAVWQVIADGWKYGMWVVGAARIRQVDPGWPEVGCRIHHTIGAWPIMINDTTDVIACTPGRELTLRTQGRPLGMAEVIISLTGDGTSTQLTLDERAVSGPGAQMLKLIGDWPLTLRNRETLRRLRALSAGTAQRADRHG